MDEQMKRRIATLVALVEKVPNQTLGRTAIMKLLYLLVAIRGMPLAYHFTLYAYGPFDSLVLEDIDYAARLGALDVKTSFYPSGYGYEIKPGGTAESTKGLGTAFVAAHERDIDWAVREFGRATAAELELISTIVYVDREWRELGRTLTIEQMVSCVANIKPRFEANAIQRRVESLRQKDLLAALVA